MRSVSWKLRVSPVRTIVLCATLFVFYKFLSRLKQTLSCYPKIKIHYGFHKTIKVIKGYIFILSLRLLKLLRLLNLKTLILLCKKNDKSMKVLLKCALPDLWQDASVVLVWHSWKIFGPFECVLWNYSSFTSGCESPGTQSRVLSGGFCQRNPLAPEKSLTTPWWFLPCISKKSECTTI